MPESPSSDGRRSTRSAADRSLDHAAIDRLATELLPALVAKLGATGLGELEVREGPWRVRLRRPGAGAAGPAGVAGSGASSARDRRTAERAAERANPERDRHADRPSRIGHHGSESTARSDARGVATSPAVGIYRPRTDLTVGDRVRAGDRLGAVDMLGVAQEVLSPIDGIVGSSLSESGDAVEYGQELLVIEGVAPTATASHVP